MAEILLHPGAGPSEPPVQQLPHNVEAEAALLGALLLDNRLVEDVQLKLRSDHFFEPLHGRIYEAILRLTDRSMIANPVTLKPLFEADEAMKQVGGPSYLAQLTGSGAALIAARDFASQIYDLALLRSLIGVGRDLVTSALDTSEDVKPLEQIERAETELYKVAEQGGGEGKVKTFADASKEALLIAEAALTNGGKLSGITTGFTEVNARMGGMHRSDLIILAGRPGMGKTSLATNIAFNAAQRMLRDISDGIDPARSAGAAVAFFSLEMSADQLATRVLAEQSNIPGSQIRSGSMNLNEFREFARVAGELNSLPLYIDDTPGLTIAALRTRARRLKRQKNIGLIIVDYLQLLSGSSKGGDANRVQEISEISRGLKSLAKELHLPVVALSQLSRAVEQREDKRPQLSDLRESGSIEQDADMVWFIYRGDYYLQAKEPPVDHADFAAWQEEMGRIYGKAELIIAKQRHGATGKVPLRFDARITKFSDLVEEGQTPDFH
ncbi:replicative DNA helicase [Sphingomonas humi]